MCICVREDGVREGTSWDTEGIKGFHYPCVEKKRDTLKRGRLFSVAQQAPKLGKNSQDNSMKVSRMTILVLSILFYFLIQTGQGLVAEVNPAGTVKFGKHLQPGHKEVGEGKKQPSPRLWKVAEGEAQLGDGADDKAASNLQPGTSKQKPSGKRPLLPLSPPKSKSHSHESHFEGHGNFNTDTYSCPGIQLKACRKPSDCDGCLGLYTCKLPKGRCDFKAVSRPTDVSSLVMKCLQENIQAQRTPKGPR